MIRLLILLAFIFPAIAQAQDNESEDAAPAEEAPAASDSSNVEEVTDEEIDELLGLGDEDYTEIEEDDFDASVEVRYEQSVPFPTDI